MSDAQSTQDDSRPTDAWLAGLLEGEGYFGLIEKKSTTGEMYPTFRIHLGMTDEDVVRQAHQVTGVGNFRGPVQHPGNRKPVWAWTVNKRDDVAVVLRRIRPWMGERRGGRIDEMLRVYESSGRTTKPWSHGSYGYKKGCRCDVCRAANNSKARAYRRSKQ